MLFTHSQLWGKTKSQSWPAKPWESCKPTPSPEKRHVCTWSSGSTAGKPYAWPKKSSPEEGLTQARERPCPWLWLLSLLLLAYLSIPRGKVTAQKTAQHGVVGADGMGISLLVPGSWDGTRSRTWVWRPEAAGWGAGSVGVVPSPRLGTTGKQEHEMDQTVLSHGLTCPGPLTGEETGDEKSAPKQGAWMDWFWSWAEGQEAKSPATKSVKPNIHPSTSVAEGCWWVARVVLVSLLPSPSPCVTTGKVMSQQLRNIHSRAENQMLSNNTPVPCSQESLSKIPAVSCRGGSLVGISRWQTVPSSSKKPKAPEPFPRWHSHEGDGEVEALPQPLEGDEGLRGEAPGGHLAVGPLELAWGALALEAPDEKVDAGSSVLAHPRSTAAGARVHLARLSCNGTSRHQGRWHLSPAASCDTQLPKWPCYGLSCFQTSTPDPLSNWGTSLWLLGVRMLHLFQVWVFREVRDTICWAILLQISNNIGLWFSDSLAVSKLGDKYRADDRQI